MTLRAHMNAMAIAIAVGVPSLISAQAHKIQIEGVRNVTMVDATIACAGATDVAAIPRIAALHYKSIVNLRLATEAGAAIPESTAAAKTAGLNYIHIPFDAAAPDEAAADAFIKAVTNKANQPVFIHCASANRASALWLAKRMLVDKWDRTRALDEARAIGLTNTALEQFALRYVQLRSK